jgi:hypothetical protein
MLSLLLALIPNVAPSSPTLVQEPRPAQEARPTARTDLAQALAKARAKNRRVLVLVFQEWHGPSSDLARVLREDREVKHELLYEYDLVKANVTMDADAPAVLRELGLDPDALERPSLIVLDPEREVVARVAGSALEQSPQHADPAKVLAFLEPHRATPLDAEVVLREALARAAASKRRLLVHFGAPW